MEYFKRRRVLLVGGLFCYALLAMAFVAFRDSAAARDTQQGPGITAVFNKPTYSSPIAISQDNTLVWSVNPEDDSVTVIRTDNNTFVKKIRVGKEPQSIALDPNNKYVYVANAAGNTVTVLEITNPNPGSFNARVVTGAGIGGEITTGAEPWNIVISPDGLRVFVANSAQDTITVINTDNNKVIGNINLRNSLCNDPDRNRHFQPRGLAVSQDSNRLYVTRFLSFTKPGGVQADDNGKEGVVCRLNIDTGSININDYTPAKRITLASQNTGFDAAIGTPPVLTPTQAFPNQLQSIVLRGNSAYLPNIAASPSRPLKFNVDTQAFINRIDNISGNETDAGAINAHLGARAPELGKTKLFFANPWAIVFTNQAGAGNAYVVSAGSDLLVKLSVAADGSLSNTVNATTTRYIDLNDPKNPATSGPNAGKNPLGIVITDNGQTAYVMNDVSRNISVVDLGNDSVKKVIKSYNLPQPGSNLERIHVGKEIFFSSRGNFVGPAGANVSLQNRLSSEGWQNCASCHFAGLTDGIVWQFGSGPRKSVPLNGSFNPNNPDDQRILNYSGIFDEVQDFELNIRNVSGPGNLAAPQACTNAAAGAATSLFDPNHGLLFADDGDINKAPCAIPSLAAKANANRQQHKVKLPGSTTEVPALDAMKEWVQFAVRTPNRPLTTLELTNGAGSAIGGVQVSDVSAGAKLFFKAGCQSCHGGGKWSNSTKDFDSPPDAAKVATESATLAPNANSNVAFLFEALKDIGSFNLNVLGKGNILPGQPAIGGVEVDAAGKDALGKDHDGDGKGEGYNIPSLLGIHSLPPYYHNGACETLACVLTNVEHRTAGLKPGRADPLLQPSERTKLIRFLESIDASTPIGPDLYISKHDIFFDPPTVVAGRSGAQQKVGVNVSLFGPKVTFDSPVTITFYDGKPGDQGTQVIGSATINGINRNFGQVTVKVPWDVPNRTGKHKIFVRVDTNDVFQEDNEGNNTASRNVLVRQGGSEQGAPTVSNVQINNNAPITNSRNVTIKFKADDPGNGASGLESYCLVTYRFDTALGRWVEQACKFTKLPEPAGDGSFSVNTQLQPQEGTAYVFVWVKDKAGNASLTPGFDVISFIPTGEIELDRNDILIFRILLNAGQSLTFSVDPDEGNPDIKVFNGENLVAKSKKPGDEVETVSFSAGGQATLYQVEVKAISNTIFTISTSNTLNAQAQAETQVSPAQVTGEDGPLTLGPPSLQAAIDDVADTYISDIRR